MATGDNGFKIQERLENQIHLLLVDMESEPERFDFKTRLSVVQVLGMWLTRHVKLEAASEPESAGSAVRRYSSAFKTSVVKANAPRGGKGSARRAAAPALAYDSNSDADEGDDSAA
jgi:hypothetical protein